MKWHVALSIYFRAYTQSIYSTVLLTVDRCSKHIVHNCSPFSAQSSWWMQILVTVHIAKEEKRGGGKKARRRDESDREGEEQESPPLWLLPPCPLSSFLASLSSIPSLSFWLLLSPPPPSPSLLSLSLSLSPSCSLFLSKSVPLCSYISLTPSFVFLTFLA